MREILEAVKSNQLAVLISLLEETPTALYTLTPNGFNLIQLAATEGHVTILAELLNRGSSPQIPNTTKKTIANHTGNATFTPLFLAAMNGHVQAARLLAFCGAEVDAARLQADYYANPAAMDLLANLGRDLLPYLLLAVQNNYTQLTEMLLKNIDLKPELPAMEKWALLCLAAFNNNLTIANLLLKAQIPTELTEADIEQGLSYQDYLQRTPLYWAAVHNNTELAELLIAKQANLNLATRQTLVDGEQEANAFLMNKTSEKALDLDTCLPQ